MLKKMCKDETFTNSKLVNAVNNAPASALGEENGNGVAANAPVPCSGEALQQLALKLSDDWQRLIPKLGLSEEQKEEIEKTKESGSGKLLHGNHEQLSF
jgi:hypothetical protein